MYIIITEDRESFKADEIKNDEKIACDQGILDVINIDTMKTYFEGEWHNLRKWDENFK